MAAQRDCPAGLDCRGFDQRIERRTGGIVQLQPGRAKGDGGVERFDLRRFGFGHFGAQDRTDRLGGIIRLVRGHVIAQRIGCVGYVIDGIACGPITGSQHDAQGQRGGEPPHSSSPSGFLRVFDAGGT